VKHGLSYFSPVLGMARSFSMRATGAQELTSVSRVNSGLNDTNTARDSSVQGEYFSSAGNSGNLDSGTSGTWEGDFVDGGAATSPISEAGRLHNFGVYNYNVVSAAGLSIDLFWADPLGASTNDYDLFLLDSTGSNVVSSSMSRQTGSQDPYESLGTFSPGERIVIVKFSGQPRFLHLDTQRGGLGTPTSGATLGHSSATNAFSVAAIDIATAYPNAFTGGPTNPVETFSSDGPRHVFYNADGSPITSGNFSSTGGAIRQMLHRTSEDTRSRIFPLTIIMVVVLHNFVESTIVLPNNLNALLIGIVAGMLSVPTEDRAA